MSPFEMARLLAALVETLLPGDSGWPSGTMVGVQAILATRLVQERGEDALETLVAALGDRVGALLSDDEEGRVAAVSSWEKRDKDLFGFVRDATFMAYYESPVVIAAINAHGHPYKLVPHITGYELPPFDLERDRPRHGRGAWFPTNAIKRVPVETLDLGDERTLNWGRKQ